MGRRCVGFSEHKVLTGLMCSASNNQERHEFETVMNSM